MLQGKLANFVTQFDLIEDGETVCVAASGGPDSTALLVAFSDLRNIVNFNLCACHIHHGIRGSEADRDAEFVTGLASSLGIPCKVVKINVPKYKQASGGSLQMSARELRYLAFNSLLRRKWCDKIATAHTADDNVETFLLNLLRGAGPGGLSGIPMFREGTFIRPMLEISKKEILDFLRNKNQNFQTDSSNHSHYYLRNKVRTTLLPFLENDFNPSIRTTLSNSSEIFHDINEFISIQARKAISDLITVNSDGVFVASSSKLANLHPALTRQVIRQILYDMKNGNQGFSFLNIEDIRKLTISTGNGKQLSLHGISISVAHGKIYFSRSPFTSAPEFCHPFTGKGTINIAETNCMVTMEESPLPGSFELNNEICFVDAGAIPANAVFRNRRNGDIFHPLGALGSRKLKKFFIDEKIPRWKRNSATLLASGRNILWIAGYGISDKVKITENSVSAIKLSYSTN